MNEPQPICLHCNQPMKLIWACANDHPLIWQFWQSRKVSRSAHAAPAGPWRLIEGFGPKEKKPSFWQLEDMRRVNSLGDYMGPICQFDNKEQATIARDALNGRILAIAERAAALGYESAVNSERGEGMSYTDRECAEMAMKEISG